MSPNSFRLLRHPRGEHPVPSLWLGSRLRGVAITNNVSTTSPTRISAKAGITSIPHSRTCDAFFLASGHSRGVPIALANTVRSLSDAVLDLVNLQQSHCATPGCFLEGSGQATPHELHQDGSRKDRLYAIRAEGMIAKECEVERIRRMHRRVAKIDSRATDGIHARSSWKRLC